MPWPDSLAAALISGYIARRFDKDALTIRRYNPPMGAMPFFNNSASPGIRYSELILFAGTLLKFLTELKVPREDEASVDDAMKELATEMSKEDSPSSKMVEVIDKYYKF